MRNVNSRHERICVDGDGHDNPGEGQQSEREKTAKIGLLVKVKLKLPYDSLQKHQSVCIDVKSFRAA